MLNLFTFTLNHDDLTLLGKGLKFCPIPLWVDHGKIKLDLDKFFRNCSLHLFFNNTENTNVSELEPEEKPFEHNDLKLPSKYNPTFPSNLEHVYYLILEEILSYKPPKVRYSNLNGRECNSITKLSDNEEIVIKKADKGSNVVVLDQKYYISEGHRQLSNKTLFETAQGRHL